MTVIVVGATALVMLLTSLAFIPVTAWEIYVPVATVVATAGVALAGIAVEAVGERLVRPVRRLVRSIEEEEIGEQSLHELVRQVPAEVAPLLYGLHITHARLRRTLRQVEQDRAEVGAIFEHMGDSVLLLDAYERIVLSNPAAERMLRCTSPAARSKPGGGRARRRPRRSGAQRVRRGAAHPAHRLLPRGSLRVRRRHRRTTLDSGSRHPLPERRRLLVLQDISELRRAEVARRDFVANVSHELRTPVAALKALVETLEQGAIDDPVEGPRFLHLMHKEVDGLAQLVTELLDLARAEAGRLELRLAPCRADELVREAAERIRPTAKQADLRLDVVIDAGDELWVCADSRRIGQVLSNLLGNATKFTPAAGRIEAGARRRGQGVECGCPIRASASKPEHLARVFERFYKTDPSSRGRDRAPGWVWR